MDGNRRPPSLSFALAYGSKRASHAVALPLCVLVGLLLSTLGVDASTPLESVHASADVTADLSGVVCEDDQVLVDDLTGTVILASIGSLPANTDVDAYHLEPSGDVLLSLDTAAILPGGLLVRPGDVFRFDGSSYSLVFDAAAAGLPPGANVDAASLLEGGEMLLSVDVTIDLGGAIVDDEDLLLYDGGSLSLYFDGSVSGVDAAQALDAAHHLGLNGHLLLSFAESGIVDGLGFDDEDVLEFDPDTSGWTMAFDASSEHAGWTEADLDALYVDDASAGAVPDGTDPATVPLTAAKSGNDITLSWSESCSSDDADYAVYEGVLGDLTSMVPIAPPNDCTTGGATSITFTAGSGDRVYLVVPQGGLREGSYGTDSDARERGPSSLACQPQLIGVCH